VNCVDLTGSSIVAPTWSFRSLDLTLGFM
jgi:hypothetical protein